MSWVHRRYCRYDSPREENRFDIIMPRMAKSNRSVQSINDLFLQNMRVSTAIMEYSGSPSKDEINALIPSGHDPQLFRDIKSIAMPDSYFQYTNLSNRMCILPSCLLFLQLHWLDNRQVKKGHA